MSRRSASSSRTGTGPPPSGTRRPASTRAMGGSPYTRVASTESASPWRATSTAIRGFSCTVRGRRRVRTSTGMRRWSTGSTSVSSSETSSGSKWRPAPPRSWSSRPVSGVAASARSVSPQSATASSNCSAIRSSRATRRRKPLSSSSSIPTHPTGAADVRSGAPSSFTSGQSASFPSSVTSTPRGMRPLRFAPSACSAARSPCVATNCGPSTRPEATAASVVESGSSRSPLTTTRSSARPEPSRVKR